MKSIRQRRLWAAALTGVTAISLLMTAACGGTDPGADSGNGKDPSSFDYLALAEDNTISTELTTLSKDQCSKENSALPLKTDTVSTANVVQKVTLLASQDALPPAFVAGTAMLRPDGDLGNSHLALDYEQSLKKLGKWDNISPAAASTIKQIYGGMYSLPYQYNLEGIFYNKSMFTKQGVSEPQTWDDLVAAMAKFKASGTIPITEGGADGWPMTRLIGMYLYRKLGPDAIKNVESGSAKLTDPDYVEAATAFTELAKKGYFGDGVISRTQDAANAQFLSGKAAMTYNGTWMLSAINDPSQNKIGADNVGFMPFPTVAGGKGTLDQWPANAGAPQAMSSKTYGPKMADWLGCIADNYGSQAMQDKGIISGFKLNKEVSDVPTTTAQVQKIIDNTSQTVLWFEAQMDSKSGALTTQNMPLLVNQKMSPEDYMARLQTSVETNKGK
ncbi:MAG TPA: extracellular solute-binding protein [Microlunatus sp.]